MFVSVSGGNTNYGATVTLAREEYAKFLTETELAAVLGGTAASIWFPKETYLVPKRDRRERVLVSLPLKETSLSIIERDRES